MSIGFIWWFKINPITYDYLIVITFWALELDRLMLESYHLKAVWLDTFLYVSGPYLIDEETYNELVGVCEIEHNVPKASHSAWCIAGSHVCLASLSSLLLKHMPGIVNKKQNIYTQGQGNCTPIRIWVKAKKGEADHRLINMPWVLPQGYSWSVKINSKILAAKLKGNKINHMIILSISSSMNI